MSKVKIIEEYQNYSPPVRVYHAVQVLLRYVPNEHLDGLHKIILTNSEHVRDRIKGKTKTKTRVRPSDCLGLYSDGQIILVMDHLFGQLPPIMLLVPTCKVLLIGGTLYHEIGHHIHRMEEPGFRDQREEVADEWRVKLMEIFFAQHYWYLVKVFSFLFPLFFPLLMKLQRRLQEEEARASSTNNT